MARLRLGTARDGERSWVEKDNIVDSGKARDECVRDHKIPNVPISSVRVCVASDRISLALDWPLYPHRQDWPLSTTAKIQPERPRV